MNQKLNEVLGFNLKPIGVAFHADTQEVTLTFTITYTQALCLKVDLEHVLHELAQQVIQRHADATATK